MLASTADIVFLVDERHASDFDDDSRVQAWLDNLGGVVGDLDAQLSTAGIDTRYGLVGFGDNDHFGLAHTHSLSDTEVRLFGDAADLGNAAFSGLHADSYLYGDGWDAIEQAVGEYEFRAGASVILVLIQNEIGRDELPETPNPVDEENTNPSLTREGLLATMASKNITLHSVVEADFVQATVQLYDTGGVVYGVESDERDGVDDNMHVAHVELPQSNNGLDPGIFSDELAGGPHRINGAPGPVGPAPEFEPNPGDTDNDYVRLAWETGGAAWNVSVIEDNFDLDKYYDEEDQDDPRMLAFNDAFIGSIVNQIEDKQSAGDVAFADDPLLEINFWDEATTAGSYVNYDEVTGLTGVSGDDGVIVEVEDEENFDISEIELNHTNTIPDNADSVGEGEEDGGGLFVNGFEASGNNLNLSFDSTAVPNGIYVVELFFAELGGTGTPGNTIPEQRLFDIKLESVTVLEDYEIYDDHSDNGYDDPIGSYGEEVTIGHLGSATMESGDNDPNFHGMHGVVKRFRVDVTDGNGLQIDLVRDPAIGSRNPLINGLRILKTPPPPRVVDVLLDGRVLGSEWAPEAKISFAQRVLDGEQLRPVFTENTNTIEIHFDIPVNISDGSELTLVRTVIGGGGGVTTEPLDNNDISFNYDPDNFIGTWTFDDPLPNGKYAIHLSTAVVGNGEALDGEWANPTNGTPDDFTDDTSDPLYKPLLVSGDGLPGNTGGDPEFRFHFALLAGDYDGDGVVENDEPVTGDGDGDGDAFGDQGDIDVRDGNAGSKLLVRTSAGDFNDDEIVDVEDLRLWQAGFGTEYTGSDFLVWQSAYGDESAWYTGSSHVAESSPVPEFLVGTLPHITNLIFSGSNLQHDPFSFDTVDGSGEQLRTVPVGGADTISITFNELVYISADSLSILGLYTANVPQLADFSYDLITMTATWRFESWALGDQYLITLADMVTDIEGELLDGDWTNPATIDTVNVAISEFPSGDGTAGGDFNFIATLLAGDANLDGIVDGADSGILIANWGIPFGALFEDGDFNGDGYVDGADAGALIENFNMDLRDVWILADLDDDFDVDDDDTDTIEGNMDVILTGATRADGDLNGDGAVTQEDLDLALAQFGLEITLAF